MQIAQVQASALSPAVHAIAIDGFCYFYPLVLMDITRRQTTNLPPGKKPGYGPANSFSHMRAYPDANMRIVVRPNFDTLYSSAWLDLTEEPVVISAPDTSGRYYLLPMLDMWTDVFASPGWRTSGTGAQKLVVVPPGWSGSLPKEAKCIDAPTPPYVWIIGRIQINGPEDYHEVHKIQDAMSITPLSQLGKQSQDPTVKTDPTIDMNSEPLKIVQNMSAEEFYGVQLLELHAPHITDWSLLARLQRIGIECGTNFDFQTLAPDIAREFQRAVEDGLKLMREKTLSTGKLMNAWAMKAPPFINQVS